MGLPGYGSDLVVDLLQTLGIEYVAFNPGASFRGLHDSIVNYGWDRPRHLLVNHEEIAVAIAHGYGKARGRPMAAIVHDTVGLLHATMAIFIAWLDRAPVLVLGGTGPLATDRRRPWIDWIHTAQPTGQVVREFVKWDDQPASLSALPESLLRGYRIAMTEPRGPVYIALDTELQEARPEAPIPLPDPSRFAPPASPGADQAALATAARWLVEAERPVVVADYLGRNAEAVQALIELAELLALAVVDQGSRFNFPSSHRFDLSDAAGEILAEADLVLALDLLDLQAPLTTVDQATREVRSRLPAGARVIDLSTRDLLLRSWTQDAGGLYPTDLAIVAETHVALPQLLQACRDFLLRTPAAKPRIEARATRLEARHRKLVDEARAQVERQWDSKPVSLPRLAMDLWDVVKDEDWVLVNRTLNWWTRRLWPWDRHDRYVGVSHGGSVGYGIGHAIGAALGQPGRFAINIQPDGDLLYTPSGLWTAAHHRVPMLIVMFNNRSYYNDEEHQAAMARHRGRPVERKGIGIHIQDPDVDFAGLARSFGLYAEGPIEEPRDLRPALERAVRHVREERRPALVDVVTQPR